MLLDIWSNADKEISVALALALCGLSFAAATFMVKWQTVQAEGYKNQGMSAVDVVRLQQQVADAKNAVKNLLVSFVAFSFLLAQSIFVDPLAVLNESWVVGTIVDATTASGGLAVGMGFFLRATHQIYRSLGSLPGK